MRTALYNEILSLPSVIPLEVDNMQTRNNNISNVGSTYNISMPLINLQDILF